MYISHTPGPDAPMHTDGDNNYAKGNNNEGFEIRPKFFQIKSPGLMSGVGNRLELFSRFPYIHIADESGKSSYSKNDLGIFFPLK